MNIAYSLLKMNNIIIFLFFILGLFYNEILIIFKNNILSNKNFLLLKNMIHYFKHVFKIIFLILMVYIIYNTIIFYINLDTINNDIIKFSFYDLENLSQIVNNPILNNTYSNNPNILINQIIDNLPNAIGATGAFHTAMKISEHVPSISSKIIIGTIAAGFTATGLSFGLTLGELYAKNIFKDQTKNNFIPYFLNLSPLDKHNEFPYNILMEMFILNSFAVSILIVLFNISLVNYIKNKNILQYLPEFIKTSKIFIIIEFFFNRYIRIWNIYSKFILIIAYTIIITDILLIQLALFCILYL